MKRPDEFTFRGATMPIGTASELYLYLHKRVPPGEFVQAVLCDEFVHAFAAADDANLAAMAVIASYLYCHVPIAARGSREKVAAWLADKDLVFEPEKSENL
jgi:hypothetical protein